ncbi:hypothetical protein EKL97_10725 [Flavobacterium sp. LS1P28]|uniref:hypothetical protein n=1 Tax=Flavobacterium sp. LS1P28 TaxID=2497752 RepID=UPI000F82E0B0|nr:hypothetical protein [Flavobacterium sp. LS1P28]RTY80545.1 hypothetical protein EKL97_10725 [Flavobacterium sp. LS1P28]
MAQSRNAVAESCTKVLKNLNDVKILLSSKSARTGAAAISRIINEAAIAYKTRVYLDLWDWNNVITEGVKRDVVYAMTDRPKTTFSSNISKTESIFLLIT